MEIACCHFDWRVWPEIDTVRFHFDETARALAADDGQLRILDDESTAAGFVSAGATLFEGMVKKGVGSFSARSCRTIEDDNDDETIVGRCAVAKQSCLCRYTRLQGFLSTPVSI
jgi:hypothetical protein